MKLAAWAVVGLIIHPQSGDTATAPRIDFARDVQPIMSDKCYTCHGPDAEQRKANLRLDQRDIAIARGAIVPGKSGASKLVRRIMSDDKNSMMPPPGSNRSLTPTQKQLLKQWIAEGAAYDRHWAFVAPVRPKLPTTRRVGWAQSPLDHFILARLEREGLHPSSAADRATLIRRVTLDLTGLPMTLAEVDSFVSDELPSAYKRVVDRLLASPRYGERMMWEWLDAARYADTNGYQGDRTRTMWPWRDWAIAAHNANLPYDQFTIEQLAGDLLDNPSRDQHVATGFHRNHMLNGEGGRIAEESRVDYVADRVDTTGMVWLGLTLGCARCHDHKFDPITTKEYYQLAAYFNNLPESGGVDRGGNAAPVLSLPTVEQERRMEELRLSILSLKDKALDDARKQLKAVDDSVVQTMVMEERLEQRDTFILIRGAYDKFGEKVSMGTPAALPGPVVDGTPKNRLALAHWLVAPANPLTARVVVNRYWQMLFGTGLVKTAEDFGVQGEPPSHPELLDWLATEFVRTGWDVKRMHKLMVMSATYQQVSRIENRGLRIATTGSGNQYSLDPDNRLLWRGPRYRLPAPMLRDQALSIAGLLVEKIGGPSVKPYQPAGVWEDATFGQIKFEPDQGEGLYRRSLYTFWRRIVGPTMFFDTSARQSCVVRAGRTNTPLHALTLLNDVQFVEAARKFAERVLQNSGDASTRIDYAFKLATARTPTLEERAILFGSLQRLRAQFTSDRDAALRLLAIGESPRDERLEIIEVAAWTGLCNLLLNLDEVVTRE